MTVYVQKENNGTLCYESSLVYRQCLLDGERCIAVDSPRILSDKVLEDCDLFVGSVEAVSKVLASQGISIPKPNYYPDQLAEYLGREVWKANINEVLTFIAAEQSVFAKSVAWKEITGQVFEWSSGASLLLDHDESTPMWLSRKVEFLTEVRAYVISGKVVAVCQYIGDETLSVDQSVINDAAAKFSKSPIAYAFDWGLTIDGRTLLVECNDGWAIGAYKGIEARDYYALLAARWSEMTTSGVD